MSKQSVAFALRREAIVAELQQVLTQTALPEWNARMEHIRRLHDEEKADPKIGEALADHRKRANVEEAKMDRQKVIDSLVSRLHLELEAKVKEYGGEIQDSTDKEQKPLKIAVFPDSSTARLPRGLWINYKMFDRP